MSIRDVIRQEEEEEESRNPVGAGLALAAFFLAIIYLPKLTTRYDIKRKK